ncbi:MAG TPA: hypothetical protein VGC87_09875 [Pyrinomonadaceae bacterium]
MKPCNLSDEDGKRQPGWVNWRFVRSFRTMTISGNLAVMDADFTETSDVAFSIKLKRLEVGQYEEKGVCLTHTTKGLTRLNFISDYKPILMTTASSFNRQTRMITYGKTAKRNCGQYARTATLNDISFSRFEL